MNDIDRYFERLTGVKQSAPGAKHRASDYSMVLTFLFFASVLIAAWVIYSAFEAQSYNRITGANVSTWQAMWVELRVQGAPR